jgi:hypothetical protein
MPKYLTNVLCVAGLLSSACAYAEDAMLRVRCYDNDVGAEVFVNGVSKGDCPINIQVREGLQKLRAYKMTDAEHEQVFEQDVRVAGGVVKTVELELSAPQLTAKAKAAQQRAAEQQAKAALAAQVAQEEQAAEAGDSGAMVSLAKRYETGNGVKKNAAQARVWNVNAAEAEAKAAEAGNIPAMESMSKRYTTGVGVTANAAQAAAWRDKALAARQAQAAQAAAQRKEAQKQVKLSQIDFLEYGGALLADVDKKQSSDPLATTSQIVTTFPLAVAADIISTPFKLSSMAMIQREATARPAAWANPDSMIAKAEVFQHKKLAANSAEPFTLLRP